MTILNIKKVYDYIQNAINDFDFDETKTETSQSIVVCDNEVVKATVEIFRHKNTFHFNFNLNHVDFIFTVGDFVTYQVETLRHFGQEDLKTIIKDNVNNLIESVNKFNCLEENKETAEIFEL